MDQTGKIVAVGLGNTLLSDLGFGAAVIRCLRRRHPRLHGIDLVHSGVADARLAHVVGHYRGMVIVSARPHGAAPGSCAVWCDAEMERELATPCGSADTAAEFAGERHVGYQGPQDYIDALETFMGELR